MAYISGYLNYKKILDCSMSLLRRQMDALNSREAGIKKEIKDEKHLRGKMQMRQVVKTWLDNVQQKRTEVQHIQRKIGKRKYFQRSQFVRLVEENIQEVGELLEEGKFPEGLFVDVHQDREEALVTRPLVCPSMEERNLRKIWDYLMDDEIKIIGVYGQRGLGKKTIVTHIHKRLLENTSTSFKNVYWVTVSQESDIHKLQDDIAKVIQLDLSTVQDEGTRAAKIKEELNGREKFVLIIGNMSTVVPLEKLGLPVIKEASEGKLIVIGRSLEICLGMSCQRNIRVRPLSMKEAWDLFMATLGSETVLAPDIKEIARSIAKKCAGLPQAITTAARSMRIVDDVHEWRNALIAVKEDTKRPICMRSESGIFKPLKLSYDRLKDEKLQQCLLYCALFPEGYKIQTEYLIVCWIAEGLIDEMETRQAEFKVGLALLSKLEDAYLLERTRDSDRKHCVKMHHLIRDMALYITNSRFMVKAGSQLMEFPTERELSEDLERVSLMHNSLEKLSSSSIPDCPDLRTFMLQSNSRMTVISDNYFLFMDNLRFLDLSDSSIISLPNSISYLEALRALLLNNCSSLRYVPSLAKLKELRELDLRHTLIEELPHGIEKLYNLQHLHLFHCKKAAYTFPLGVLPNISHLRSLTLFLFIVTKEAHVKETKSLMQLEVLALLFYNLSLFNCYVKTQHWQRLSHYSLQRIGKLDRLSDGVRCREVHISDWVLLGGRKESTLYLPTNIQQLTISACHDINSLSDISTSLENARELERCWIEACMRIDNLWSWTVPSSPPEDPEPERHANNNNTLLESLRTLVLSCLPNLIVLFKLRGPGSVGGTTPKCGAFFNLQKISVGNCPNLRYVFTRGMVQSHLQNLEVIHVYHCPEMEKIIVAEEEEEKQGETSVPKEEEKEERASNERNKNCNSNPTIITCPKLESFELTNLPNLKSIWSGTMVCPSLQEIFLTECPLLERFPLFLNLDDDDTQPSSIPRGLKKISGEQGWWDSLKWDSDDAKSIFQSLFDSKIPSSTTSQRAVEKKRAVEIWRKDAERYEN